MEKVFPTPPTRTPNEDAERWFGQAAGVGNVNAMANFGRSKLHAGERDEAERWLTAAAKNGHEGAMQLLMDLLTQAGRQDEVDD